MPGGKYLSDMVKELWAVWQRQQNQREGHKRRWGLRIPGDPELHGENQESPHNQASVIAEHLPALP